MCIHPRCKNEAIYRLTGTKWEPRVDLCAIHGPIYQKEGGGKLLRLGKDVDEEETKARKVYRG